MLYFNFWHWKCKLLIHQINWASCLFLFLLLFILSKWCNFIMVFVKIDDFFVVWVHIWDFFDPFIILIIVNCAIYYIFLIFLILLLVYLTVLITLLFIDECSQTAIRAAHNQDVANCWRPIFIVRKSMVLKLLELYCFLRSKYSYRNFDLRLAVLSKGCEILVRLNPILLMEGSTSRLLSWTIRCTGYLITDTVPKVNIAIFTTTDYVVHSLVNTGLNWQVFT